MKTSFATLLIALSFTVSAHAKTEMINYNCDEIDLVTVEFENNIAVAIYGVNQEDPENRELAMEALNEVDLRVSKHKNGIIFTIITDDHLGETMDVRCARVK